jgi:hypothetical protein
MPRVPRIRQLLYSGEQIGMGFDSETGEAVGTALQFDPPTREPGMEVFSRASIITSQQSLTSAMDMSIEAEGRYGLVSASLKVDFHKNTTFNSTSTFVLARCLVKNQIMRGHNFRVRPEAQQLLESNRIDEFRRAYGDSFVRGLLTGGEFYTLIRLTSMDTSVQTSLSAQLEAELNGVVAAGSFKASFATANSRQESRSEYFVTYYQRGGAGEQEAGTTLEVDEVLRRLRQFPTAVLNHPFPYQTEMATYDTIPLPVPPSIEQEAFLEALADANRQKLLYMQRRNDYQFALDHPEFFVNLPPTDVLRECVSVYTHALNAVITHGSQLTRGRMIPPQFFDLANVNPSIVLPQVRLKRRTPEAARTFVDWYVLREEPSLLREDRVFLDKIEAEGRQRLHDFEAIRDPNNDLVKTTRLRAEALNRVVTEMREFQMIQVPARTLGHLPDMLPSTLRSLWLAGCGLTDILGIGRFGELESLRLEENQLNDISELAELERLTTLNLSQNQVIDLLPLTACRKLSSLEVGGNQIRELDVIQALPELKNLGLGVYAISVINDVTTQKVHSNPFVTTEALKAHPQLNNPFAMGNELKVRYGNLAEGPQAQFEGVARKLTGSLTFDLTLTRGVETRQQRLTVLGVWADHDIFGQGAALADSLIVTFITEPDYVFGVVFTRKSDRTQSYRDAAVEATRSGPSWDVEVVH